MCYLVTCLLHTLNVRLLSGQRPDQSQNKESALGKLTILMLRRDTVVFLSTSKQLQKNPLKIVYVVRRDKFLKSMLHQLDLE